MKTFNEIKTEIESITKNFKQNNKESTSDLYFTTYVTNINNEFIYVGKQTVRHYKKNNYFGSGKNLTNYIKEHGKSNLTKNILFSSNNVKLANELEKLILNQILKEDLVLNLINGSSTANILSNEKNKIRSEKISKAKLNKPRDKATKIKISNAHQGKMILRNIKTGELSLQPVELLNQGTWIHKSLGKKYNKGAKNVK